MTEEIENCKNATKNCFIVSLDKKSSIVIHAVIF